MTPPTLAIEIRSSDQSLRSLRDKCRYYRAHGVDAAWIIDPLTRRAEVFDAAHDGLIIEADATLECPAVPGFSLDLADLFALL